MERTLNRALREEWSMRNGIDRLLVGWCRAMHDNITWPQRGKYHCKTCGRCYPVPWVEQERVSARAPAVPLGAALEHARTA